MNPTITAVGSTDADLVIAARRQEPGAFGELFRRWYDRCYDVALNIVRDRETAADVAQDAFLVGWERLMDLRDPEAFGGWILRTTRNRALNRVTRDRHRAMEPIEPHEGSRMPDPDTDPALHAERSDQRRLVWTAVAALGERDISLLDLHLRHGLEPAEIAEELRITPNNASQLLFRLRRKLREAIGAVLLWRDGHPTCQGLARLLGDGGGGFDLQVATTIRRHQRECDQCLQELSAQTNPERMFAAVPLAVAPLVLKQRAAMALARSGIPMSPPAAPVVHATSAASGPPQGAGRLITAAAAGLVGLGVVTAVLLWPSGGDHAPGSAAGRQRTVSTPPAVTPLAAMTSPGSPATRTAGPAKTSRVVAPLAPTTHPVVVHSHAPRTKVTTPAAQHPSRTSRPTTPANSPSTPAVTATPPAPGGNTGPAAKGGAWTGPGAGGECHHPRHRTWGWGWTPDPGWPSGRGEGGCPPSPCPWAHWPACCR